MKWSYTITEDLDAAGTSQAGSTHGEPLVVKSGCKEGQIHQKGSGVFRVVRLGSLVSSNTDKALALLM